MKRISYFDLNEEYEPKASFSFISLHLIGAECQRKNLMRTNIWNKRRQCSTSAKSAISARNQSRTNVSQPVFMRKVGKQYEREREDIDLVEDCWKKQCVICSPDACMRVK